MNDDHSCLKFSFTIEYCNSIFCFAAYGHPNDRFPNVIINSSMTFDCWKFLIPNNSFCWGLSKTLDWKTLMTFCLRYSLKHSEGLWRRLGGRGWPVCSSSVSFVGCPRPLNGLLNAFGSLWRAFQRPLKRFLSRPLKVL